MMPLVSVVCLCYNHKAFVRQAVESVINQTYSPIQIIVADDASDDGSVQEIELLKKEFPRLELILLPVNIGNCKAFNTAYQHVTGDFVIDFATDDVMTPDRIEKQVHFFLQQSSRVCVVFTDATYVDGNGTFIKHHFEYLLRKRLIRTVPQGDVYRDVLSTYFISGPTMMVRRQVFEELQGYDESLSYEDFDFWIRSSRIFKYRYQPNVLVKKRKLKNSLSHNQFKILNKHSYSTYKVCTKILELNRTDRERDALRRRIEYEIRQSIKTLDAPLVYKYFLLWFKTKSREYR